MRKFFFTLVLVMINSCALADWAPISASNDHNLVRYIESTSIRKTGDKVKAWFLSDLGYSQPNDVHLSSKEQDEFDCKKELGRIIYFDDYSGNMGEGDVTYTSNKVGKWLPISPDTIFSSSFDISCGKKQFTLVPDIPFSAYVNIGETDNFFAYVSTMDIRREGSKVKMWIINDYKVEQSPGDPNGFMYLYNSSRSQTEYDCKKNQMRTLSFYAYAEHIGNGRIIYIGTTPDEWNAIQQDSIGKREWDFACNKKLLPHVVDAFDKAATPSQ